MFCYSENEPFTGSPVPYHLINANASWLTHYKNQKYLEFMEVNGTFTERKRAAKELAMCHRKKDRMEKHPNFCFETILPEVEKINKDWQK